MKSKVLKQIKFYRDSAAILIQIPEKQFSISELLIYLQDGGHVNLWEDAVPKNKPIL